MTRSPLAGKPAPADLLDLARLERDYYTRRPDMGDPGQLVSFGTSGHRGTPLDGTFTEAHILAITQAICEYRRGKASPARSSWARTRTPSPARPSAPPWKCWRRTASRRSSSATTASRRRRSSRTPSSSTTADGRRAWPTASSSRPRTTRPRTAASSTTRPTAAPPTPTSPRGSRTVPTTCSRAGNAASSACPYDAALKAATTHQDDFVPPYVTDLGNVIDMEAIRAAGSRSASIRWAARRRLLGADRDRVRARHHGRQSDGRSDVLRS